jgi:MFS family permease
MLARFGVSRAYAGSMLVMAVGYFAAAASPNVWVAALCCVVLGLGDGAAVTCNALLVQRGTFDVMRGRALTFVMSATYVLLGIGEIVAGLFLRRPVAPDTPRWLWVGAGTTMIVAAFAGWLLARNLGGETASEVEAPQPEHAPVAAAN